MSGMRSRGRTKTAGTLLDRWSREAGWADWRWQLRRRARSLEDVQRWLGVTAPVGSSVRAVERRFPVWVTPYYAGLIRAWSPDDPIYRLCLPDAAELAEYDGLSPDPFGEGAARPTPHLLRRYRDRALILATTACAVQCRHCTRKHSVGRAAGGVTDTELPRITRYLRSQPDIREALISGGDPLVLSTARLARILAAARAAPNIEIVRLGTRVPVTLPQRVTPELARMLRRFHPLWINTHFNHPAELTPAAATACARLADAGIPLGNQTVLLRGINDSADVLEDLFRGLLRMRVRPYYLLQGDPVRGAGHFRTPVARGVRLIRELRGRMTGLAVPAFVVDLPGGGGKAPLSSVAGLRRQGGRLRIPAPGGAPVWYPDA